MTKASKNNNVSEDMLKNAYEYNNAISCLIKPGKSEYERLVEENEKLKRKARCFDLLNTTGRFVTYQGEHYHIQKIYVESNRVVLMRKFENSVVVALDDFLNEVMDSDCKKGELYDY